MSATKEAEAENTTPVEVPKAKLTRDEMRARVFSAKPASEIVSDFFGMEIELRQPTLEVALEKRNVDEAERVYVMLTDYCFVPGSDEKLFDTEDVDELRGLPFGGDFQRVMNAVNKLLGLDPAEVEANIKAAEKST